MIPKLSGAIMNLWFFPQKQVVNNNYYPNITQTMIEN